MPLGRTAKEKVKVSNVQVAVRAGGDLGRDPDRVDHVVPASPTFGPKNNADVGRQISATQRAGMVRCWSDPAICLTLNITTLLPTVWPTVWHCGDGVGSNTRSKQRNSGRK